MHLRDYLSKEFIFILEPSTNKDAFLDQLARRVAERLEKPIHRVIYDRLCEREAMGSTGIGNGVAIPHATIEGLEAPFCVIAKIRAGVEFKALDDALVHIVFLLLSPPNKIGSHLRLLARIARLLMNEDFVRRVIEATGTAEVFSLVEEEDARHV